MTDDAKGTLMRARSIGPRMVLWLEQAGYREITEFAGETVDNIVFRVEAMAGVRLNANGRKALANLIDHARNTGG